MGRFSERDKRPYLIKEGREIVLPSRERSLELLSEDDSVQFASDDESTEDQAIQRIRYSRLHEALARLEPEELALIKALYFLNMGEREYAKKLGISQKGVNKRRHKVLAKLRHFIQR